MQRRVLYEIGKVFFLVSAAIVRAPSPADGELVEAQHVQHTNMCDHCTEEIRTLVGTRCGQQTTVRATTNRNLFCDRVLGIDEILSSGTEIVKDILLSFLDAGLMPVLTVLTTATDVGNSDHSTKVLNERNPVGREGRLNTDRKTTIAVEKNRQGTVTNDVFGMHKEHGDLGAILARVKNLLSDVESGIKVLDGDLSEDGLLLGGKVVAEERGRREETLEAEEELVILLAATDTLDGAETGQFEHANLLAVHAMQRDAVNHIAQHTHHQILFGHTAHVTDHIARMVCDHLLPVIWCWRAEIDSDQLSARCLEVGEKEATSALVGDVAVLGVKVVNQSNHFRDHWT
mmetsp:Transcript_2772/g.6748  ORF Transcript_2772/g.6748 Transcript_2772/m.6748 type:complete len:345 (-) Transcript_2772:1108-2142(-)